MKLLPEEKETILIFDETGEPADLWTCSQRVADMLLRRGLEPAQKPKEEGGGWRFFVPKQSIRLKVDKHQIRIGGTRG